MANYRVKQRWLSGRGKKQFSSGDIVTERDFPDNIKELLAEGRIEVMEEEDSNKEDLNENENAEKKAIFIYNEKPIFTMEDISKPDLQACLLEATIPFKPSDNKDALWNALMNSMEQSQD